MHLCIRLQTYHACEEVTWHALNWAERKIWFSVESKSFEITVEVVIGKVVGSRKAVEEGLERGRKGYLLELRSNAAGRFCCALFALWRRGGSLWFFLKVGWWGGWGVVGTLARKLRSLGISSNHKAEKLPIVDMPPVAVRSQGLNLIVGSSESEIESHLRWLFDKFAAFSLFLGMLVKGFEKEILALLRKMEDRQRKKAPVSRKRCKRVMSSSQKGRVNNEEKRKVIKSFIKSHNADLVCLQEIKVEAMSLSMVRSLGVGALEASRAAGRGVEDILTLFRGIEGHWGALGGPMVYWRGFQCCGSFTWCGGQNKQSMLRIDCFLLTSDQEEHFSNTMQTLLPRPVSDHSPIPLEGGRVRRSKTLFRFENMWFKVDGFKDLVKGWSEGYQFSGSSNFIFQAEGVEGRHQTKEREGHLSTDDMDARRLAVEEFSYWAILEENSWRQKFRAVSLKEGDKNTRINGELVIKEPKIAIKIVHYFKLLLSEPMGEWRPSINGLLLKSLSIENSVKLEEAFTEKEVFEALMDLNRDKAPRPDGFSLAFWQDC
ncbi:hypothetical protein CK203_084548 [Vitis vinifera]|uniref:Endonuclease/exonuclease/phosphatase domain-containing protein n=2 Tax=Vitis vinifera TaxID=29760 RepID=A0A438DNR1_VITVI|nr:hypothetical protein CK203_084548 [Vitis vinifera]